MPELIDKGKLLYYLEAIKPDEAASAYGEATIDVINHIENYVSEMPTAEQPTIEPKRGEWIDDRTDIICSNCKTGFNYEMLLFIREALESGTVDGMECRCPKCGSYNQYGGADNG